MPPLAMQVLPAIGAAQVSVPGVQVWQASQSASTAQVLPTHS